MDLKMIAISRLMLDNFDHIKAFWIMIGESVAQLALSFGADDMDGDSGGGKDNTRRRGRYRRTTGKRKDRTVDN